MLNIFFFTIGINGYSFCARVMLLTVFDGILICSSNKVRGGQWLGYDKILRYWCCDKHDGFLWLACHLLLLFYITQFNLLPILYHILNLDHSVLGYKLLEALLFWLQHFIDKSFIFHSNFPFQQTLIYQYQHFSS